MNYKILGKIRLLVSEIGLGGIEITRIHESEAINLIRESFNLGINLIDTEHLYPNSEEIIGKAIKGFRHKVILSIKSMNTSRKEFIKDIETSLNNLKTDYIDIFLFHDATFSRLRKIISNGLIDLIIKEKEKGKINHFEFSCHNYKVIEKYCQINDFSVLMLPVNFISTEFTQDKIYKKVFKNNIGVLGF
jgi:aryl-alcohol dehydrogenase-like predicted oxidoreductase